MNASVDLTQFVQDANPEETAEWRDALLSLLANEGPERVNQILNTLTVVALQQRTGWQPDLNTPYANTISVDEQQEFPGDIQIEERLTSIMRWNALAMVVRANQAYGELGGHIASYASVADLFETGFHHFFQARTPEHGGDLVFFQPHSAPGVYARAFLEGRLTEEDLLHYRQEINVQKIGARGLSSYPHPWLMPSLLWVFRQIDIKTVSPKPKALAFASATYFSMTPAVSSALTRARQGEGERPIFRASSTLVKLPSRCKWSNIRKSVLSKFIC